MRSGDLVGTVAFNDFEAVVRLCLLAALCGWMIWALISLVVAIFDRELAIRIAPKLLKGLLAVSAAAATTVPAHADSPATNLDGLQLPDRPSITASAQTSSAATGTPPAKLPLPSTQQNSTQQDSTQQTIVVQAGDCLWSIVEAKNVAASDQTIAKSVAAWHRANRSVIGPNPDLLQPGQRLTEPGEK